MTVGEMIEKLSQFPRDTEVVIIVDRPQEFPRAIKDVVADDFDEINRAAVLTAMEEA